MYVIVYRALEGSIRELDEVLDDLAEPDLLIAYQAATLASEDKESTFAALRMIVRERAVRFQRVPDRKAGGDETDLSLAQ